MPDPDPPARTRRAKAKAPSASPPAPKPRTTRKRKPAAVESDSDSDGGFVSAKTEQPKRNARAGKKTKSPSPDEGTDDATEEDEGPQMSDARESEDELPPPRRPIGFGAAEKEREKVKEPYDAAGAGGDVGEETEDDEL